MLLEYGFRAGLIRQSQDFVRVLPVHGVIAGGETNPLGLYTGVANKLPDRPNRPIEASCIAIKEKA